MITLNRRSLLSGSAGLVLATSIRATEASAAAAVFAETRETAARAATSLLAGGAVPSVSYALVGREGAIFAGTAGVIDKVSGAAPTDDTLYGIGSCSKVFAVAAIMRLAERGQVEIDAPLVKYLPSFRMLSGDYDKITLRMLMNHSSGLPGSEYRNGMTTTWHADYLDQVIATAAASRLKDRPGELAVYCNDGFTLLEAVVRAVTGTSFADFMEAEILRPLGMASSRYGNRPAEDGSFAPGFDGDRRLPREISNLLASGGLQTTPTEWARFLAIFLNGGRLGDVEILKPSSVAAMAENQTARLPFNPLPPVDGFGLGWDSVNSPVFATLGLKAWRKNGGTAVYSSDMIVLPDAGLGVVVTAASPGTDAAALSEHILFAALAEQRTIKAVPSPVSQVLAPVAGKPLDDAWFEGVFGTYEQTFRFEPDGKGGATQMRASGGSWTKHYDQLQMRTDGSVASDALPGVRFWLRDYEGITYLTGSAAAGFKTVAVEGLAAQKLGARPAFGEAWQKRMGKTWLFVNTAPDLCYPGMEKPAVRLDAVPGAPGYVIIGMGFAGDEVNQPVDASQDEMRALMCLKAPGGPSRDLNDLVVLKKGAEEWLQYGSWIARPVASVPALSSGTLELVIGPEGHAEWVKLGAAGGIDIAGASDWQLYGDDMGLVTAGKGDVSGLAGLGTAYALVYAAPGKSVRVTIA